MAISLNIAVSDISVPLGQGYTHFKLYRSTEQTTGFAEITTPSSIIALEPGVNTYLFTDESGTTRHYYKTTYYDNSNVVDESAFSSAFTGTFVDSKFTSATYPPEAVFTGEDYFVIDKIRLLTGDPKELTRDYVSVETGYSSISVDGTTHSLSNPRGWPLIVELDGIEYTTKDEPHVNDYRFITFSGTTISTISGVLDLWYYHFRYSDTEILRVYNAQLPPIGLDADQVTFELQTICAAIDLLEGELRLFGVTAGSEVDIFQEIRINPKGGFDGRFSDLEALRRRKKEIIDAILAEEDGGLADICGVLID